MFKFHKQDLMFFIVLCQIEFGLGMLQMFMSYMNMYSDKWLLWHVPTFIPFVIFDEGYFRKIAKFNGKWTLEADKTLMAFHLLLYVSICLGCIFLYKTMLTSAPYDWIGLFIRVCVVNSVFFLLSILNGVLIPRGYWDFYLTKVGRKK
ncbi:MAG: hypothetical protein KIH69_019400 [Anaerolineae bacterium]|nr:hypothetical protein [Anaerolineae bacterium]